MATRKNEATMRRHTAQNDLLALETERDGKRTSYARVLRLMGEGRSLSAADQLIADRGAGDVQDLDGRIAAAREKLISASRELDAAEAEERHELAASEARAAGANGGATVLGGDDGPALSSLPALPARTRAALATLYGGSVTASTTARREQWQGTLAAALGGQPLHPALLAATATERYPADGGYAVPPDVAAGIFSRAFEESLFARLGVRVEAMSGPERFIPALDDDDETNEAEATLAAGWQAEADDLGTPQLLKLRSVKLTARKLIVFASASNELAEDAPSYLAALEGAMARAIAKRLDRAIFAGTGAGAPLGLMSAPATISVPKQSGQPASTFLWVNATEMWSRLAPGSHENAWWVAHPTTLPALMAMSLPIGTSGAIPAAAFQSGGPTGYLLLGRPVVVSSRVNRLGQLGDVVLVDPTQLAVGIRRGATIERSAHVYFASDRLAIRGTFRGDVQPLWDAARTLGDGVTTVSPYVVLAERS